MAIGDILDNSYQVATSGVRSKDGKLTENTNKAMTGKITCKSYQKLLKRCQPWCYFLNVHNKFVFNRICLVPFVIRISVL